jgi:hypothetical protein
MNEPVFKQMQERLKHAVPPMPQAELRRDLWPTLLRRLDQRETSRVPWFDWALLGALAAAVFLFPAVIPALLYHL